MCALDDPVLAEVFWFEGIRAKFVDEFVGEYEFARPLLHAGNVETGGAFPK